MKGPKRWLLSILPLFMPVIVGAQQLQVLSRDLARELIPTYKHLHSHPELSLQEKATSEHLQKRIESYGYQIIKPFAEHGFVGVLTNGPGKVVLVRADMDALPVREDTGASFASTVSVENQGESLPVMHACGHDVHMTSWLGTARLLSEIRDKWQGTVVFLAQPAEEFGDGARKMINDGLFEKIPIPDFALALHVSATLAAGNIGLTSGYAYANVDAMEITIFGMGGHGAYPHTTIDPVVLSSRIIMGLQTLVSREFSPLEPLVITVGAIDGGTKGNVIPNKVHLKLTIRYHNPSLRPAILRAIKRLTDGSAASAGLPQDKYPKLKYYPENLPGVYNHPGLTQQLKEHWVKVLGSDRVMELPPTMGGEDFGRFGTTQHRIPICIYWLGSIDPKQAVEYQKGHLELPSLHSSLYLPEIEPTLQMGIESMASGVLLLLREN